MYILDYVNKNQTTVPDTTTPTTKTTTFRYMANGDIGVIITGGYKDRVVMRIHDHVVCLNAPDEMWLNIANNFYTDAHTVKLCPAKTQIVLTVK